MDSTEWFLRNNVKKILTQRICRIIKQQISYFFGFFVRILTKRILYSGRLTDLFKKSLKTVMVKLTCSENI